MVSRAALPLLLVTAVNNHRAAHLLTMCAGRLTH
jgi:hypothetical protein